MSADKPLNSAPVLSPADEEKIFSKYLLGKKIVIADPSSVSRAAIAKCMSSLGAKVSDLALVTTYESAEQEIDRIRPAVVICDFNLGRRCGLDLLQMQRAARAETKDMLFILVTGNTSQSAVARAAEEDIDTFILKPFTIASLRASILKAGLTKISPPKYLVELERGKAEMNAGRYDEARQIFEGAKAFDASPALACFYIGQTRMLKQAYDGALQDYTEGLGHNQIHYKCLVGLYELLMKQNQHARAYEVIRKIAHYFPANPQRMTAVLRLAITVGAYDDIDQYYGIFTNLEERSEEIIRHVCAALVVCGKHYLKESKPDRAIEFFQKAAVTGLGRAKILREIVISLTDAGRTDSADEFLMKFPPELQSSVDYAACNLLLTDRIQGASFAIARGREYLKAGVHDPLIYKILIHRSTEAGFHDSADELKREVAKRWPTLTV
jgi:two-component system chemotaxis response regulator CheY